jgi:hypothetical protein
MKGALRVALLLFTALPVHRWLLAAGAVILVGGYLLPQEVRPVALVGLILAFFPTLCASGVLLRHIVAPRVMQLIPHMRLQILGAMAWMPFILATAFTIVTLSLQPDGDHLLTWLRVAAVVSAILISQFVLIGGATGAGLWFSLVIVATLIPGYTWAREFLRWIAQSPGLLIVALVMMWCGFAIWLLRARPFAVPRAGNMLGLGTHTVLLSQHNAVRAFLFANPSLRAQFAGGLLLVMCITLLFGLIAWIKSRAPTFGDVFSGASWMAIGVGAYAGIGGWFVARRSKFLWLRCGLDRLELFRLCEREAWTSFVATASGTLVLLPLVWLQGSTSVLEYGVLLGFQLCSGLCLLYLGLMRVRGWRALDVLCALALFFAWGIASGSTPYLAAHLSIALALSAAMLVAAFALRLVGLYRWRRIDWLVCKPPLPLARSEMNPV